MLSLIIYMKGKSIADTRFDSNTHLSTLHRERVSERKGLKVRMLRYMDEISINYNSLGVSVFFSGR